MYITYNKKTFEKPAKVFKDPTGQYVYVRSNIRQFGNEFVYDEIVYPAEEYKLIELEQIQKEQDKILLEQDLKLMCLDVPVPVFLDNLDNSMDKNSHNLLFRIIENKNYRDKSEFINIIEFYYQKNKISNDNKNNLIKLINSK